MRIVIFCHSLISDWNHGNAHFLRGVGSELRARGNQVTYYEPEDAWSMQGMLAEQGEPAIARFKTAYPELSSVRYRPDALDLDRALDGAGLVLVHEWNDPELVRRIGERHRRGRFVLFFHDTHHRAVTAPDEMARYDLSDYDGVLAFGEVLRQIYLARGWTNLAFTWHEAADARRFRPLEGATRPRDVVFLGNWGQDRTAELDELFLEPVKALGLRATVQGVRYPPEVKQRLADAGVAHTGWVPNFVVPLVLGQFKATVHIPRRPYARALPGIPTIRVFEALCCGIPLVSAPWEDSESLFTPGEDFLVARDGAQMRRHLALLVKDREAAQAMAARGRKTVLARHTCAHRVDELLALHAKLRPGGSPGARYAAVSAGA
ncbi:MAG TPA: glycosyltransferase [Myxococcales bacterium]|nr:glycosyltransferase [Myxococcales bacterium]